MSFTSSNIFSQTGTASLNGSGHFSSTLNNQNNNNEGSYVFEVEWYDDQAGIARKYHLFYYLLDGTIEMYDIKNKRTFLKRCSYPSIQLSHLYIGAQISVYARQLKILAYGNEYTRNRLEVVKSRTMIIVKPDRLSIVIKLMDECIKHKLTISKLKMCKINQQIAEKLSVRPSTPSSSSSSSSVYELTRGSVVAMEVVGPDVQQTVRAIFNNTDAGESAFYSTSNQQADLEYNLLFESSPSVHPSCTLNNCTIAVIKPHAINAGLASSIIHQIEREGERQGWRVSGLEMFYLDRRAAEEFCEVYKTVVPDYNAMVEQYTTGPSIAIELTGTPDIVERFRSFCGPSDPEVARHIRPHSLRALFGQSKVRNAVHCTDLPEDGVLESEFFFSILQKS